MSARGIAAALVLAGAFAAGWLAQGWRAGAELAKVRQAHAEVLASIATKTRETADAVRAYEQRAGQALSAADKKHTEDLNHEKAETQRLRDCVRAGTCGVRIVTRYANRPGGDGTTDTTGSSVGDATCTLNAGVSESVFDLRDAIAADTAALSYLQDYARQCAAPWSAGDRPSE